METQSVAFATGEGSVPGGLLCASSATVISISNASDFWTKSLAAAIGFPFTNLTRTRSFVYQRFQQNPEGMEPFAVKAMPQTRVLGVGGRVTENGVAAGSDEPARTASDFVQKSLAL